MIAILDEAQAFGGLVQSYFARNNPVDVLLASVKQTVDYVMNFQSHKKLMKYRSMVYLKQLNRMEENLWSGIVTPEGEKLDRYY